MGYGSLCLAKDTLEFALAGISTCNGSISVSPWSLVQSCDSLQGWMGAHCGRRVMARMIDSHTSPEQVLSQEENNNQKSTVKGV